MEVFEFGVEANANVLLFFGVLGDEASASSSINYENQLRVEAARVGHLRQTSRALETIPLPAVFSWLLSPA